MAYARLLNAKSSTLGLILRPTCSSTLRIRRNNSFNVAPTRGKRLKLAGKIFRRDQEKKLAKLHSRRSAAYVCFQHKAKLELSPPYNDLAAHCGTTRLQQACTKSRVTTKSPSAGGYQSLPLDGPDQCQQPTLNPWRAIPPIASKMFGRIEENITEALENGRFLEVQRIKERFRADQGFESSPPTDNGSKRPLGRKSKPFRRVIVLCNETLIKNL